MKKSILASLLFLAACGYNESTVENSTTKKDTTDDTFISTTPIPLAGCYISIVKHDTSTINLTVSGNEVSGRLSYNFYEKDKNTGTIKGIIKDSLVVADYTFQSEGMTSVREVAFKIKDGALVEGYGDYKTGSDTMRFEDIKQIKFQEDRLFTKVACD